MLETDHSLEKCVSKYKYVIKLQDMSSLQPHDGSNL